MPSVTLYLTEDDKRILERARDILPIRCSLGRIFVEAVKDAIRGELEKREKGNNPK